MKISKNKAFTLVEILVVCGIVGVFMGTAMILMTNFRRGFSRSENTAVLMQEGALFIARLRTDLNNAVLTGNLDMVPIQNQLAATADKLQFQVYSSQAGKTMPITYTYAARNSGGTLMREEAGKERVIIKDHVASLSWQTELERFATPGSGTFRLSIALHIELKVDSDKEKAFTLKTSIFPARMNRQINNP